MGCGSARAPNFGGVRGTKPSFFTFARENSGVQPLPLMFVPLKSLLFLSPARRRLFSSDDSMLSLWGGSLFFFWPLLRERYPKHLDIMESYSLSLLRPLRQAARTCPSLLSLAPGAICCRRCSNRSRPPRQCLTSIPPSSTTTRSRTATPPSSSPRIPSTIPRTTSRGPPLPHRSGRRGSSVFVCPSQFSPIGGKLFSATYVAVCMFNRLTALRFWRERKTRPPTQLTHKHHHHGGAVRPSYGVGSMDPPNLRRVTSSKRVGQGRFSWA
jgi:hypothetical protein